ncbi:GNAT family N-acetyltransferase [Neisseria leonii]|uniref:GNAT family N-acetyltransferase n=1 Tax=Neisseria leonii TaxID=2995413 RepID=A0A9X4E2Y4_9NEIS|nr:GNAT family N-acetyltransferase [Neisseria sp. 51.81]MDD9328655.1 GNAT family N-acetyltransferase [Neisseria sp. 51.81]
MTAIRSLTVHDADLVQTLYGQTPDYFLNISGRPAEPDSARENLTQFPPGIIGAPILLGAFEGGRLVGILIAVVGYPTAPTAHIGLLLVHPDSRGRGVGRALHEAYLARLGERAGIRTLRLGIVSGNARLAEPFWRSLGYEDSGARKPFQLGAVTGEVRIFTRARSAP